MTKLISLTTIWMLLAFQLMIFLHEISHVATAWVLNVQWTIVDVYPARLTFALFEPSRFTALIVWNGFLLGSIVPFGFIPAWNFKPFKFGLFLNVWASFCIAANGLYLCLGVLEDYSDSGMLIELGWSWMVMVAAGGLMAVAGYWLLSRKIAQAWAEEFVVGVSWKIVMFWGVFLSCWVVCQYWIARILDA